MSACGQECVSRMRWPKAKCIQVPSSAKTFPPTTVPPHVVRAHPTPARMTANITGKEKTLRHRDRRSEFTGEATTVSDGRIIMVRLGGLGPRRPETSSCWPLLPLPDGELTLLLLPGRWRSRDQLHAPRVR